MHENEVKNGSLSNAVSLLRVVSLKMWYNHGCISHTCCYSPAL